MKSIVLVAAFVIATVPLMAQQASADRILVKYRNDSDDTGIRKSLDRVRQKVRDSKGVKEYSRIREIGVRSVECPKGKRDEIIKSLTSDPTVEYAEPDYIATVNLVPNDPYYATYQWHLPKIGAPAAWDTTTGNPSVRIAVVDSGVDPLTPDLSGRLLSNGYDFVNFDSDPRDDNGHGTAVAGTAAASGNNGQGVAGIAWGVSVLPVKVMDSNGMGSYSAIASGINYAATNGAKVINLSLGGTNHSRVLEDAVNFAWSKGAVVIAAAGNNGTTNTVYPAAYSNCMAISAINSSDSITSWSSRGSYVDLCAPGENIATTGLNGTYVSQSGTSFASPIVAGVAALAISRNNALKNSDVVSLMIRNADDLGTPGPDAFYGYGRVNVSKVISSSTPVADSSAPSTVITSPRNGSSITRSSLVTIRVSSSDNIAVTRVEVYLNGVILAVSSSPTFSLTWNTFRLGKGTYRLQSKAYDAAGNSGLSPIITVTK